MKMFFRISRHVDLCYFLRICLGIRFVNNVVVWALSDIIERYFFFVKSFLRFFEC